MSVQNFNFPAPLEVAEKFVIVVENVEHVDTVSNSSKVALELRCVELRWVLTIYYWVPGILKSLFESWGKGDNKFEMLK